MDEAMTPAVDVRPERPAAPLVSLVTPAFREEKNLPALYERIKATFDPLGVVWEWMIVDDHSPDATFAVGKALAQRDPRIHVIRFSRNFGSHAAVSCGLRQARGDVVAVLAADLQDPPEALPDMLAKWGAGAAIVWAVRSARHGESAATLAASRLYYWVMRQIVGLKSLPPAGADFLILDRGVVDAVNAFTERNVSLLALISWLGFEQDQVFYEKQARLHGSSGWSLAKKLKLLVDSVTAFSYLPIRFMSWTGVLMALIGFLYALVVIVNALIGAPVAGWASLMVAVLVIGGLQMAMLGVLGEYIWRNLDEARRRPLYVVETRFTGAAPPPSPGPEATPWTT